MKKGVSEHLRKHIYWNHVNAQAGDGKTVGERHFEATRMTVHDHEQVMSRITWPWFKPPAIVSLDDRAVRFIGEWMPIPALIGMRPWNKNGNIPVFK